MKNETAVLTAVFPAVLAYVPDLITSLSQQTTNGFDWVVLNDGINSAELQKQIQNRFIYVSISVEGLTPSENRWKGISHCLNEGYKYIIFQDADDWMSINRVADSLCLLQKNPIVFHALNLVDANGQVAKENIWTERLASGCHIGQSFIQDKNCVGLGNTAIQAKAIKKKLEIPEYVLAVDWFIFYHLLRDAEAFYSGTAQVYYRQYATNMAGLGLLTQKRIAKAVLVKQRHYAALIKTFPELKTRQQQLEYFQHEIFNKPDNLSMYILKNEAKGVTSFWWEETNYSL